MIVIELDKGQDVQDLLCYQRGLVAVIKELAGADSNGSLSNLAGDIYYCADLLEKITNTYSSEILKIKK